MFASVGFFGRQDDEDLFGALGFFSEPEPPGGTTPLTIDREDITIDREDITIDQEEI